MKYQSTRTNQASVNSAGAIALGLAPDGGLFVPEDIPIISQDEIVSFAGMSYNDRANAILCKYLTDFTSAELGECVEGAYTKEKFETINIAPIYKLEDGIYILELWHGPTCAFKDMALQILPRLLTRAARKYGLNKEIVILAATSGDTGKAALEGFRDVEGTRIIVFYPKDGVSRVQELQMTTQEGRNVAAASVLGNFDDAQAGVKAIFSDKEYARKLDEAGFSLSSANSINWGRLAPQIVYYFSCYADLLKSNEIKEAQPINVVVPTGNFGNILAAYYAKRMGLPIHKLICASNSNNVLADFINTGIYNARREFLTTISPSMDILISSNLERLMFHISDGDHAKIRDWMNRLKQTGQYEVVGAVRQQLGELFWAGWCNDVETMQTISDVYKEYDYLMDTHTAVAKRVYDEYRKRTGDTTKTIIASTANPFKFSESVLRAIWGEDAAANKSEFQMLDELATRSGHKIPKGLAALKTMEERFNSHCAKDDMCKLVTEFLEKPKLDVNN